MVIARVSKFALVIALISGCQISDQGKLQKVTIENDPSVFKAVEVTNPSASLSLTVRHMVSDGNVFVECYVPGFQFTKGEHSNTKKEGHLRVSVDQQKSYPVYKAAFIIKDLSKGTHQIDFKLVDNNGVTIEGLERQLRVEILQ